MDNDSSQEKTEEPTSKRLDDARKKGQIARSKDFNNFMLLVTSGFLFLTIGRTTLSSIVSKAKNIFVFDYTHLYDLHNCITIAKNFIFDTFYIIAPFFICVIGISILSPIIIGGWIFSTSALAPKFSRIDPIKGFKRMFSLKSLVELIKSVMKFLVVAIVAVIVWYGHINDFLSITMLPLNVAITKGIYLIGLSYLLVSCGLILIAIVDVPFQLYQHSQQLKMTKQEVKDEHKDSDGKPEVKSRIRRVQQEMAQRRMMSEVPKADVILTNPDHYSVALSYQSESGKAPTVIAKGKNLMAINIAKIGKSHNIPLLRLPPLARAIYFSTKLDHQIPRGLYIVVAQVLAYIYQLKKGNQTYEISPANLEDLNIPDELQVAGE